MTPNQAQLPQGILVVDDESAIRDTIAISLVRSGYRVDTARDGADAWKALNQVNYHLLITDHKMPKLTGLELIQKLRSEAMTLPVILISGMMPTEEMQQHPGLRVDATLLKPFAMEALLQAVKNTLNRLIEPPFADLMAYRENLEAAQKAAGSPPAQAPVMAPVRAARALTHHILVVDDNQDTRQASLDLLTASGYQAEGVKDGVEGLEELLTCDYDLVITDNQMPRMTGIQMIAKLYAARLNLPVIMATGQLPTHEFASRPWLTPDATLQRPFSSDDLLATVRRVLHTDDRNQTHMELLPRSL
jgi:chemotaxis family two-component system sensor histidine kinase/response regulator PixL